MPPNRYEYSGLVQRSRGGLKPQTPSPPRPLRTPAEVPLDGPNYNTWRENPIIESPDDGDDIAGNRSGSSNDYDPDDRASAEFYRDHRYLPNDDPFRDFNDEVDDDESSVHHDHIHHPKKGNHHLNAGTDSGKKPKDFEIGWMRMIFFFVVFSFYGYGFSIFTDMTTGRGAFYRLTQQPIVEGEGQAVTQVVHLLHHGQNRARNTDMTEELLAGNICAFSDTHAKARQVFTDYLKHVPNASPRLQDHAFLSTLADLDRKMAKNTPDLRRSEYRLCLYTELDVKSNFLTANYPLADLELFSNLYQSRLESFQADLQTLETITESIMSISATLQDLASGCGEHISQIPSGDAVCKFLGMYSDINTATQSTYAPRMTWYGKIKEHVDMAQESLAKTLFVLQGATGSRDGGATSKVIIRDYAEPFVNAMTGLILTVREGA